MTSFLSHTTPQNLTLLIVDDEEIVRSATRDYLTRVYSFTIDTASSATHALSLINEKRYDAIISDFEMEDINGIELLKIIRGRGDDTPFILFTGRGREEVAVAAFENGADGYVMKGGEFHSQFVVLVQKITSLVEQRTTENALRELEDKFKDIYSNSPVAIELYDESGILIDINPACCALFGVRSADEVRKFHLFDDPNISEELLDSLKKGDSIRYTADFDFDLVKQHNLYHTTKSGILRLGVQITPMYHGDHKISGYLVQIVDITKETRAQEEINNQKRFLDRLLETIPSPVFYKDAKGRYTGCNSAFEEYIGLLKKEIIGKTSYDIVPKELADIYYTKDKELFDTPGVQVYESRMKYADGSLHDVIFQKATLMNLKEEVQGLIGVMLDITDRKKIELALQKNEAYVRAVLDNLPIGVAVNSATSPVKFSYFNKNFLKLYRGNADTLTKPDALWNIFEDPGFRKVMKERVIADCASGDPARMHWDDIPIIRKGEETTFISAMTALVPDRNLMISTVWDVTDRKNAEDSLRDVNRLLEGALDGIPDIISIQKPDYTMIRYNRAGYEVLGLTPEDVIGKPCYSFIGRTIPCEICATKEALEKKKIVGVEKYVPELKRHLICRSNPILDDSGEVRLIVEQLTDITSRKQMEEAISQSNQKLRLLTGLTRHDILNLLTAIHFYHEMALENPDVDAIHGYVTKAHEAGKRIEATIGFTREYEEFGVASSGWQAIYRIVESAKREISPGTIAIENKIPPGIEVFADPIIRKVFTTLLENAIRHGKTIDVITFSILKKEDDLIIVCEDNGVGISLNDKIQIFGRGFGENTGIGLFLAREILSITDLSIRECGQPGTGARFEILVPDGKWRE